jgi:tetratricopeptide (TPR) repeat protein
MTPIEPDASAVPQQPEALHAIQIAPSKPDTSPVIIPRSRGSRYYRFWLVVLVCLLVGGWLVGREIWSGWQERSAEQAYSNEDYENAHLHINRALQVRSDRISTNFLAARIERARRAYPEAENYLNRCKGFGGVTAAVQMEWLLLRCEKGDVDELASEMLAAVNQNHPESAAILESIALVYMRQIRYPEALVTLDKWIERYPDSPRALEWRGWVSNQLDHRGQAIDDYNKALELQPTRSKARLQLAQILIDSSRHAEALPHFEQLQTVLPKNPEVLTGLAACRIVQLRRDEARELLEEVLADHPNHFAAILLLGNLERDDGRYLEAEHWLRKAIEQHPLDPAARYSLHLTLQAQPDRQEEAERERLLWEKDREAGVRLAQLLRGKLSENPNDPDLAAEAGEILLQQGEDQRALFWLKKAVQIDQRNARSHRALAAYYEKISNIPLADEHRKQLELIKQQK